MSANNMWRDLKEVIQIAVETEKKTFPVIERLVSTDPTQATKTMSLTSVEFVDFFDEMRFVLSHSEDWFGILMGIGGVLKQMNEAEGDEVRLTTYLDPFEDKALVHKFGTSDLVLPSKLSLIKTTQLLLTECHDHDHNPPYCPKVPCRLGDLLRHPLTPFDTL